MDTELEGELLSDETSAVLRVLMSLNSDSEMTIRHMREVPIRVLRGRTIAQAVADGDAHKVLRYLQTISGGQNG